MTAIATREVMGKSTPERAPWTSKELQELRRVAPLGALTAADILGRSIKSVRRAAERHGISLRQSGSNAGRLLGQPNGSSYADARAAAEHALIMKALRDDVAAGRISLTDLDRALAALESGAPLCPSCGRNPADRPREGICTGCHNRRLAAAHNAARDAHDGQQDLWRTRQTKSRRSRRGKEGTP